MIARTLALAALSFSALAAHAAGDAPAAEAGLSREAVIAELVASREAPRTTPRDGEWYNIPAPLSFGQPSDAKAVATAEAPSSAK
ncbi:MAG: hypothetical protein EOO31_08060 [Comamonadaceae bacterium]|nr:MAG: hypothetical protein EOO31_08060 [Comamonadaceae bacterium]